MADVNVTLYTTPYGVPGPAGSTAELASKLVGQTFAGLQQFTEGISCGVFIYDGSTYSAFMKNAINFDTSSSLGSNESRTNLFFGTTYYNFICSNASTYNSVFIGYDNFKASNSNLSPTNTIAIGHNNADLGITAASMTQTLILGSSNIRYFPSVYSSVILGFGIGGNNAANLESQSYSNNILVGNLICDSPALITCIENAVLGHQALSGIAGITLTNNVVIGTDALNSGTPQLLSNNVVVGYRAGMNEATDLQNSVIIGPALTTNNNQFTIRSNPDLGNTQLKIGSGRTAWISGSCLGYVGIGGVTYPEGNLHVRNSFVLNPVTAPTIGTSPGVTGSIAWDNNYIYVCAAGNSWRRAPLSPF